MLHSLLGGLIFGAASSNPGGCLRALLGLAVAVVVLIVLAFAAIVVGANTLL